MLFDLLICKITFLFMLLYILHIKKRWKITTSHTYSHNMVISRDTILLTTKLISSYPNMSGIDVIQYVDSLNHPEQCRVLLLLNIYRNNENKNWYVKLTPLISNCNTLIKLHVSFVTKISLLQSSPHLTCLITRFINNGRIYVSMAINI